MDDITAQFALGAVALLMLKEVLSFGLNIVKSRNGKEDKPVDKNTKILEDMRHQYCEPMLKMQRDLYDWHNVHDQDGVRMWYIRPSLAVAIKELSQNVAIQTEVFKNLQSLWLEKD